MGTAKIRVLHRGILISGCHLLEPGASMVHRDIVLSKYHYNGRHYEPSDLCGPIVLVLPSTDPSVISAS